MARSLALPKQYRGSGDLRAIVDRNTRTMLTFINQLVVAKEDDGSLNLLALPKVILPSIESTPTGVGFYGAPPATKPTITGSRGGNVALGDLLTALAGLGLINDNTTA